MPSIAQLGPQQLRAAEAMRSDWHISPSYRIGTAFLRRHSKFPLTANERSLYRKSLRAIRASSLIIFGSFFRESAVDCEAIHRAALAQNSRF